MSPHVKAYVKQEIKELIAVSCDFLLEVLLKLEMQCRTC